jgi:hypothetical protein
LEQRGGPWSGIASGASAYKSCNFEKCQQADAHRRRMAWKRHDPRQLNAMVIAIILEVWKRQRTTKYVQHSGAASAGQAIPVFDFSEGQEAEYYWSDKTFSRYILQNQARTLGSASTCAGCSPENLHQVRCWNHDI